MQLHHKVLVIVCLILFSLDPAHAAPGLIDSLGHLIQGNGLPLLDYPLAQMMTKSPSPECAKVNQGARLCCKSTFNGDVPLLLELAPVIGYNLNKNSVNGIYCMKLSASDGTDMRC